MSVTCRHLRILVGLEKHCSRPPEKARSSERLANVTGVETGVVMSTAEKILPIVILVCLFGQAFARDDTPDGSAIWSMDSSAGSPVEAEADTTFRSLDEDIQRLKNEVLELNTELFLLEEEFLYPANSQVAFFVSMDVGDYFGLESISLTIDGRKVASHVYSERENESLARGAAHRIHIENLKIGEHEVNAEIIGEGSRVTHYRRGATINIDKGNTAKYVELEITDRVARQQPEFVIKEWE